MTSLIWLISGYVSSKQTKKKADYNKLTSSPELNLYLDENYT